MSDADHVAREETDTMGQRVKRIRMRINGESAMLTYDPKAAESTRWTGAALGIFVWSTTRDACEGLLRDRCTVPVDLR